MSDTARVEFDTSGDRNLMRALADTEGMDTPEQAAFWLEGIAKHVHRGPRRDTWTSARDRAAEAAGIEPTMAKRIWQRWRDMRDVPGATLIKLMVAYELLCVASEARADRLHGERMELRGENAAAVQKSVSGRRRAPASTHRALQIPTHA